MSIEYTVDRARELMVTVAEGRMSVDEVRRFVVEIVEDPATDGCDELVILRDVDLQDISSDDVRGLAQHSTEITRSQDFKTAVVAPRDADFGLFRMYEAFRNRPEGMIAVFRNVEEAMVWLGVDELPDWAKS